MHKRPPGLLGNVRQALLTNGMARTPRRFVRGILDYTSDPDVHMSDFDSFLPVGSVAPDFTLETLDGEYFTLSDHRGEYVVLEFGSYTCPMFRRQLPAMADLAREWADDDRVTVALLYGPEAHPDQGDFRGIDQPTTRDERLNLAERLVKEEDVPTPVLVDDLPRRVSGRYGGGPNMIYVIDPDGRVAYCDLWTDAGSVRTFLEPVLTPRAAADGG